jgi:beta-galactosidase
MNLIRSIVCFATLAFVASTALFVAPVPSQAQERPQPNVPLYLGTAWYPEQWPESRWDADLALMEKAHIRFVRITEFAWSTMEPSEGHYDLDWVERAVRMAEKHHVAVVLGTPSAAPPAWLTSKYPETLRTMEDGRKGTVSSSTGRTRSIVSWPARWLNRWRFALGTIRM